MITSSANARVKNITALLKKSKERKAQGLFVAEGTKLVQEAPEDLVQEVYVSESYSRDPEHAALLARMEGYEVLSDELFERVSDTKTPQGILALVRIPQYEPAELLGTGRTALYANASEDVPAVGLVSSGNAAKKMDSCSIASACDSSNRTDTGDTLLMVLEDIQDPGNLGTILRTAEAAGVTGILMSRGTADLFAPKVVRSTMGSIYRMPFYITDDLAGELQRVREAGVKLYAAHLRGTGSYDAFDYREPTGFLIGNEGNGLSDAIADCADAYVRIPMQGSVESLNAAVSAALLMYEADRQRRSFHRG